MKEVQIAWGTGGEVKALRGQRKKKRGKREGTYIRDGALGSIIPDQAGPGPGRANGSDVDDGAAVALLDEARDDGLRAEEDGFDVHPHHEVEVGFRHFGRGLVCACSLHQHPYFDFAGPPSQTPKNNEPYSDNSSPHNSPARRFSRTCPHTSQRPSSNPLRSSRPL